MFTGGQTAFTFRQMINKVVCTCEMTRFCCGRAAVRAGLTAIDQPRRTRPPLASRMCDSRQIARCRRAAGFPERLNPTPGFCYYFHIKISSQTHVWQQYQVA